MSAASVGKTPWYKAAQKTRSKYISNDMEFDNDVGGWHAPRKQGWKNSSKVVTRKAVRDSITGKTYNIYATEGYSDFIHFHNMEKDEDALDYAINAFQDKAGQVVESDGAGHIKSIAYAVKYQVLRVKFAKGADCFFFKVPTAVAGSLLRWAQIGPDAMMIGKDGTQRHILGIQFWNLVRVRGTVSSTRYPFSTASGNISGYTGSKKRYVVHITPENAKIILGNKYSGSARVGDLVETVLSEQEYKKYLMQAEAQLGNKPSTITRDDYIVSKNLIAEDADGKLYSSVENVGVTDPKFVEVEEKLSNEQTPTRFINKDYSVLDSKDLNRYRELQDIYKQKRANRAIENEKKIIDQYNDTLAKKSYINDILSTDDERGTLIERERARRGYANMQNVFDERSIEDKVRYKYKYDGTQGKLKPSDFNSDAEYTEFKALDRQYNLPAYAKNSLSKYWTTSDLKAMADPSNPHSVQGKDFIKYKELIDNKDYREALTFLQTNSPTIYRRGKATQGKRYASPRDKLARQEYKDD